MPRCGTCANISYDLVRQAQGEKPYPMSLVGEAARAVEQAVNIGIDSHLEACFVPERGDSYEHGKRSTAGGVVHTLTLECEVSPESLPVLLRRLFEQEGEEGPSLASSILETIGIDDEGKLSEREEE